MPYAIVRLHLSAQIGEVKFDNISQFVSTFAVNTLPAASLLVAVGRDAATNRLAEIHTSLNLLPVNAIAHVWLTADVVDIERAEAGVTQQRTRIFKGTFTGVGWQRNGDTGHFSLHLSHWLNSLDYASAMSASLHPGSPAAYAYPAVFPQVGFSNVAPGAGSPAWTAVISDAQVTSESLSDIWGNVLHPWMTSRAEDDPIDEALSGDIGEGNAAALGALELMRPNPAGKPLALKSGAGDRDIISSGLRKALMSETGGNWINNTLWGKLVGEWAPAYWFSVVPRVEDALIVPFAGGLSGEPWAVIGAEDYASTELSGQLGQVLRAVGIAHPLGTATGFDAGLGVPFELSGLSGFYQPDGIDTGMLLLKQPPKWLSDPLLVNEFGMLAEGLDGNPVNTAMDEEDVGGDRRKFVIGKAVPQPREAVAEKLKQHQDIMTQYAKQWYVLEMLKARSGTVAGKLRFDVCPGSNVLVKAGSVINVPQAIDVQADLLATVSHVAIAINSESQRAGTVFTLSHIRTATENQKPGFSIDGPALYEEAWPGASLVEGAPGPEK